MKYIICAFYKLVLDFSALMVSTACFRYIFEPAARGCIEVSQDFFVSFQWHFRETGAYDRRPTEMEFNICPKEGCSVKDVNAKVLLVLKYGTIIPFTTIKFNRWCQSPSLIIPKLLVRNGFCCIVQIEGRKSLEFDFTPSERPCEWPSPEEAW